MYVTCEKLKAITIDQLFFCELSWARVVKMSGGSATTKKPIQVKYKKISFKDLEFDQGDDVRVLSVAGFIIES